MRIALVTGASSGIGKALISELLELGYEVIAVSRSKVKLEHPRLSNYTCDVSNREEVRSLGQKLHKTPTLFFLNAGISGHTALENTVDVEHHQKIFAVNYFGVLNFMEVWRESKGVTFMVSSSIVALFAPPRRSAYSASKAAIAKAFDSLRLTKRDQKFLTVFIPPVDTPGLSAKLPFTKSPQKMAKYMIKRAEKGKARSYPSWLYTGISKVLNKLPSVWVAWMMGFEKEKRDG